MHEEIKEKIEYLIHKQPEKIIEFAKKVYRQNPDIIEDMLDEHGKSEHISSEHKYKELTDRLKWSNQQGKGERWKPEDIKRISKINFENEDFTEWDFAYLVNMLYAKCCKEITDITFYVKLAKCLLTDTDEETKMYHGAFSKHKQKHQGMQSRYDDYDEESRRYRRYRNEDYRNDYESRYEDYRNEDYRRYRNEASDYDSRYRDNRVGFN